MTTMLDMLQTQSVRAAQTRASQPEGTPLGELALLLAVTYAAARLIRDWQPGDQADVAAPAPASGGATVRIISPEPPTRIYAEARQATPPTLAPKGKWLERHPAAEFAGLAALTVLPEALKILSMLRGSPAAPPRPTPAAPPPQQTAPAPVAAAFLVLPPWPAWMQAPTTPPAPTYTPPSDAKWLQIAPHPSVILILGKRGSGKSALGYRLLELFRARAAPYVVGLPQEARKLLPDWIGYAGRLEDAPTGATVLLDEAYLQYAARDAMSDKGRGIGAMINLSRQKGQTLIFIVQEARQLDVNAISQADVIAVKELSEISREFERPQLRRITDKARVAFVGINSTRPRLTWVYSETAGEVGLIENELATFWKPALSRAFANATPNQPATETATRPGTRTPRAEVKAHAKSLHLQGRSYGGIAVALGCSRSQAYTLVHEA